jgi:hypothetical protein
MLTCIVGKDLHHALYSNALGERLRLRRMKWRPLTATNTIVADLKVPSEDAG